MKTDSRGRRRAGGIVVVLIAFGVANAAAAMFRAPQAEPPLALKSTQQLVDPVQQHEIHAPVLTVAER